MKKITTIILSVLLIALTFMSCDNATKAVQDELVEVTLSTQADGRSLTVENTLESLSSVSWYYKATKVSEPQFNFGQKTTETSIRLFPSEGQTKEILTLSQGKWVFELFGRSTDENGTLLYHGRSLETLILKENGLNQINVEVSPYTDAPGSILFSNVTLTRADNTSLSPNYVKVCKVGVTGSVYETVKSTEDGKYHEDTSNKKVDSLAAGQYEVIVAWKEEMTGDNPDTTDVEPNDNVWDLVIASETIYVTVYGGRTTTISGFVSEETGSGIINTNLIVIDNALDFYAFASSVNSGNDYSDKIIMLGADIDLNNEEWTPIGQKAGNKFSGVFDGNNKTISGLSITENNIAVTNASFDNYVGLFGAIENGTVKRLKVSGSVTGINAAGIVARMDSGTIEDCISNVTVVGTGKGTDKDKGKAGGIVCLTNTGNCTINNCTNNGNVSGVTEAGVGGIAAYVRKNTTISGCTNNAEIGSNTDKYSGGIAGYVTDSVDILIKNCTNTGSVTAYQDVGGIVGTITGVASITSCSNSGAINAGENGNGGGIAGSTSNNQSTNITGCGNTASVHGKYAGGVIGVNGVSTITNCSGGTAAITSPAHVIGFTGQSFTLSVDENRSSGRIIGAHQGAGQYIYTVIELDDTNNDSNGIPTVGICGNTTTESYLKISSGTFHGDPLAGRTCTIVLAEGATWGGRAAGTYTSGGLDSFRKAEWTI